MTTVSSFFKDIIACVSDEMLEKLKYACESFIKELLILQYNKENEGNYEEYEWLNIMDTRGRTQHINILINQMFIESNDAVLSSVVSDYFVPEYEDVIMLKRFADNYYIKVYNYTQEMCDNKWWNNYIDNNNITFYSNSIFEIGMCFYMKIHHEVVVNNLFRGVEYNTNQLK